MSKKKKKNTIPSFSGISLGLAEETKHTIYAIVFFVLGVLFLLAPYGQAGEVGNFLYANLKTFLGVGFFLLPVICFLLGIALLRSMRPNFALPGAIGSVLFLLSGLGLISAVFDPETGGYLGSFIAKPLISLFDIVLTDVLLAALLLISLLAIFDTRPTFAHLLFWRRGQKEKEEEVEDEDLETAPIVAKKEEAVTAKPEEKEEDEEKESFLEKTKRAITKKKEEVEDAYDSELHKFSSADPEEEYSFPPLSLLLKDRGKPGVGDLKANTNAIKRTLRNFGIVVEMDEVSIGPSVTRYALKPAEGVKLSRIMNLQNELALALATHPVRIEAPIPKTSLVGIEVPNTTKSTIGLASLLGTKEFQESSKPLMVGLGKGISGNPMFANIAKMPHLLIAGTTGSGKSVTVHALITSLLYRNSPSTLRFIMVDPKRVELTLYNGIPHLLSPVITDPKKAVLALKWLAKEMNRRYDILEEHSVRDIQSYHENVLAKELKKRGNGKQEEIAPEEDADDENGETSGGKIDEIERMPYIVVIIDELADIMQAYPRELEAGIVRLAQMSRAVGIHVVLSTQRPSVNVITGLIKANVPARIALQVASQIDSRTIIDMAGAEKLLGQGDMLYMSGEMSKPTRLQSAFVSEKEVKSVVKYLRNQASGVPDEIMFTEVHGDAGDPIFSSSIDNDEDDELYEEAREIVVSAKKASTSYLQRKLKIGYSRAARLMDILEERGVIGPADGSKPRQVLEGADEGYGRDE
ncbi:MAG TPA: DNA translocase FtsK 4TM domain-containing protein [Candidatus Paceibacterota bacterium]|nr:DNA translocase FtsK 4TM domain-containing protein [Candidatus Paceibacterota bacterium]